MARTKRPEIPTARTKFYFYDHYKLVIQKTDVTILRADGFWVPKYLYWMFYKDEPVLIRDDLSLILRHIHSHYEIRKRNNFCSRYEKVGLLPDFKLKPDNFKSEED